MLLLKFASLLAALFAGALSGAMAVRALMLRSGVLSRPSPRGLHRTSVPLGGGFALVIPVCAAVAWLALGSGELDVRWVWVLAPALLVSAVGWADDAANLHFVPRLIAQFLCAAPLALWAQGQDFWLSSGLLLPPALVVPAVLFGTVAFINFYNFMDGIDGLALGQAVLAAGGAFLLLSRQARAEEAIVAAAIAVTALGVLPLNWQPAKLFIGDMGAYFLGFMFSALATLTARNAETPLAMWVLLLFPFLIDPMLTLIRRWRFGEVLYRPHKRHAYQRLTQVIGRHAPATLAMLALSSVGAVLGWLAGRGAITWGVGLTFHLGLLLSAYWVLEMFAPMRHSDYEAGETKAVTD